MLTLGPLVIFLGNQHLSNRSLSIATEFATAESPWIPPHTVPIGSYSATDVLSPPILSPQERHCSSHTSGSGTRRLLSFVSETEFVF